MLKDSEILDMLSKFGNRKQKYTLFFDCKNMKDPYRRGETHYISGKTKITIYLNEQTVNTRSDIGLAVTLLHEIIHAKLYAILEEYIDYDKDVKITRDKQGKIIEKRINIK